MSYSRWSHSIWYTFWSASASGKALGEQAFDVFGERVFTYAELKPRKSLVGFLHAAIPGYDMEHYEELAGYVREWFLDVEKWAAQ